ncbi:ATP-grasp domain-containing protein [Sphaerisporangium sp. TRM90804]|uniref:ATP-grasp domain-containing protein n=1 Tax=Sphaerisporangium sp. TRM90804 TaxID=3031113 RepID=UPI00244BE44C|nr:ATP-grasp domain-containing protein [Sphaerisporangium sp. TRM90804]MDH2429812.1 ATP-grasp domain-containing protein [Sphaerisporangium sp. TRM90804]
MRLYITALNPTDAVTGGFLPAARALGCEVTLLTDQPERYPGTEAIQTDVRDARAVVETIARHHPPAAVFSNSDHLQPETALAAGYFGLPGKDWRACLTAKNKALTRRALAAAGVETVRSARLAPGEPAPPDLAYPVVVKPREGVASEDVTLARDAAELERAVAAARARRPGAALVAEEYLEGPLHTLETLGDGRSTHVLGGLRTTLGPLPHFVEERLDWDPSHLPSGPALSPAPPDAGPRAAERRPAGARETDGQRSRARGNDGRAAGEHVLRALAAVGAGFGACHTEYVMTERGPRIVEVNYRLIGDTCDFLLAELLGVPLFEWVLRVHLGEPAPAPPPVTGHGAAVSLVADRPGVVTRAPGDVAETVGGTRVRHRPLRAVGDTIELTRTNRDYLGVVRGVGPGRDSVDKAIEDFSARHPWTIE